MAKTTNEPMKDRFGNLLGINDMCQEPFDSKLLSQPNFDEDIMYLKCACGEYKHVIYDQIHMDRCK